MKLTMNSIIQIEVRYNPEHNTREIWVREGIANEELWHICETMEDAYVCLLKVYDKLHTDFVANRSTVKSDGTG